MSEVSLKTAEKLRARRERLGSSALRAPTWADAARQLTSVFERNGWTSNMIEDELLQQKKLYERRRQTTARILEIEKPVREAINTLPPEDRLAVYKKLERAI